MQFLGVRPGSAVEFRVGDRHGAEAGNHRDQRLLFGAEGSLLPRINQNRTLGS